MDLQREKSFGVHLPHRFLCINCGCSMDWFDYLQNPPFINPTSRHGQLGTQLWNLVWDCFGSISFLLSWHGQGPKYVPAEVQLVVTSNPIFHPYPCLWWDSQVCHKTVSTRILVWKRDLLLIFFTKSFTLELNLKKPYCCNSLRCNLTKFFTKYPQQNKFNLKSL